MEAGLSRPSSLVQRIETSRSADSPDLVAGKLSTVLADRRPEIRVGAVEGTGCGVQGARVLSRNSWGPGTTGIAWFALLCNNSPGRPSRSPGMDGSWRRVHERSGRGRSRAVRPLSTWLAAIDNLARSIDIQTDTLSWSPPRRRSIVHERHTLEWRCFEISLMHLSWIRAFFLPNLRLRKQIENPKKIWICAADPRAPRVEPKESRSSDRFIARASLASRTFPLLSSNALKTLSSAFACRFFRRKSQKMDRHRFRPRSPNCGQVNLPC